MTANGKDLLGQLEAAVAAIQSSDDFRRFLRAAAQFHTYSLNNQLLIWTQRPDATRVAGYKAWQKLGRQVRRGETGIKIMVPFAIRRRKDEDEHDDEDERRVIGFGVGHVFDVSQTDGEPLPTLNYQHTSGETQGALLDRAIAYAQSRGLTIDVSPPASTTASTTANGYYNPREGRIWINAALDTDGRASTILHELAHVLDENIQDYDGAIDHRGERETVAEAASYVVGAHFGFDVGAEAATYIAGWAQDPATFKTAMADIHRISARLIDALDGAPGAADAA